MPPLVKPSVVHKAQQTDLLPSNKSIRAYFFPPVLEQVAVFPVLLQVKMKEVVYFRGQEHGLWSQTALLEFMYQPKIT